MNILLSSLGLRYPLIQAPMAGVATPELAAAVSNAGGLGSLGIGASSAADAQRMILKTQALTSHPFNVNVFCHEDIPLNPIHERQWIQHLTPHFVEFKHSPPKRLKSPYLSFNQHTELLKLLLTAKPAVVSFHFGLPTKSSINALKEAGIFLMATVTNLEEAHQCQRLGMDVIIAQGYEAGGHRGVFSPHTDQYMGTLTLTRQLVRRLNMPVVAAGGIMDGAGIDAALALGAIGVQLGTAFLLCPETATSVSYRAHLQHIQDTVLTADISGREARSLFSPLVQLLSSLPTQDRPAYPYTYDATKQLISAATNDGNPNLGAFWAGQGVSMIREMPATELINALVNESHTLQHRISLISKYSDNR